jgi:uncharacterized protein YsxB (DUF464 family)
MRLRESEIDVIAKVKAITPGRPVEILGLSLPDAKTNK